MGCNMHAHIELRLKDDNTWHHYGSPAIRRDYDLFSLVAGKKLNRLPRVHSKVMETGIATHLTKLPEDASIITKISYKQDNERYTPKCLCVLPADSLVPLQNHLDDLNDGHDRDLEGAIFRTYINGNALAAHQGYEDLRIICWFDN